MRFNLITTATAIALTAGFAGYANAQVNPTEDEKRPGIETKHTPAERAGQTEKQTSQAEPSKRDETKPADAGRPSPRPDDKRTGQAEPADKRMDEKRTGQVEPAEKRMDDRRTGQAEPADKRMDDKRMGQAQPSDKRMDEKRADQVPGDKRVDDHRRAAGEAEPAPANRHNEANVRVEGNVHISQERAARVTDEIARRGQPTNITFAVDVGARIPETVILRPLPPEIVQIAPEYRGYDYVYSNDEIVFIQPETHEVVGTIVTSGNSVATNDEPQLSRPKPCPVD